MSKSNITKASSFIIFAGFMAMALGLGGCAAEMDDGDGNEDGVVEEIDPGLEPAAVWVILDQNDDMWQSYSKSNTASATTNTYNAGFTTYNTHRIRVSTNSQCLGPASASGDTYIRLFRDNTEVAYNDDSNCGTGSLASYIDVTNQPPGNYTVKLGCFTSNSCSGNAYVKFSAP